MIKDKNGKEIKAGDRIMLTGTVAVVAMDLEDNGKAILQIKWDELTPVLDYVESIRIEKLPESKKKKRK
jgi:hypothetical protein